MTNRVNHQPTGAYLPIGQLEDDRCKCGNEWPCPTDREEWCICGYRGWVVAPGDTHTQGCSDQWRRLGEDRAYRWGPNAPIHPD